MIRVFFIVGVFMAFAAGFAWLADNPGNVQFTWGGREIETSLMVFAIGFVGLVLVIGIIWSILRAIWRSPHMLMGYFASRRRDKGYNALSTGLVAVGEGDAKRAQKAASEAKKYLKDAPLAMLLKAQSAQLAGEHETARKTFHAMLEAPETKLLGLRGLFMEAERINDPSAALQLAMGAMEEATKHPGRPNDGATVASWAGPAVLRYQSAAHDWDGALKTISANNSAGLIDRKEVKRKRAVVLVAKALHMEDSEPQEAKLAALEAHKLAPELIPAAVVSGRVLSRLGELRRAVKTLESTWKLSPHPDLADAYAHVRPGDSPRDRVKRIKTLTRLSPEHLESAIALAKTSIEAQDWETARAALRPHLTTPTQRACLLMADIEEGEHGDKGRVREWLAKAVHAAADPVWVADGVVSDHWAPVSPISGLLDAYEWTVPRTALGKPSVTISENDVLLEPLELEAPAEVPAPPQPVVQKVATKAAPVATSKITPDAHPAPVIESKPEVEAKSNSEVIADKPHTDVANDTDADVSTKNTNAETSTEQVTKAEVIEHDKAMTQPDPEPDSNKDDAPSNESSPKNQAATENADDDGDAKDTQDGPNFIKPENMRPRPDDPGAPEADDSNDKRFKLF